jgi:virulence-associated protein VagC
MKRTERITRVIQRQGVESVVIPPAFHLEATAVVVRREGERLVLIPLAGPGTSRQGHAPKPRPNLTTVEETREASTPTPTFEVIGGPYPRFGSWSGRLQRLWAWATPSAVHARVRDRAWHEGFEAGRCARAEPAVEPHAVVEPAVVEPAVVEPAVEPHAVVEPAVVEPAVVEPAVEPPPAPDEPEGIAEPFPWLERFKARLATGEPMPSPDRPEGERLALELLELRKGD